MALSPSPASLSASLPSDHSYSSLYSLLVPYQRHSSIILKFRISNSVNPTQVNSQPSKGICTTTKTKRKLRSSFFEEIRGKWSLKHDSPRERFPWQVQDHEEGEKQDEEKGQHEPTPAVLESSSDPTSIGVGNRLKSAPWDHGSKPSKPQIDFAHEVSANGKKGENFVESGRHCELDKLHGVNETPKNCDDLVKYNRSCGVIGAAPTGLLLRKNDNENEFKSFEGLGPQKGRKSENFNRCIRNYESDDASSRVSESSKNCDEEVNFSGNMEKKIGVIDATLVSLLGEKDYENKFEDIEARGTKNISTDLPWKRERNVEGVNGHIWRRSNTALAEKSIPEHELKRLKNVALRMLERIKVGAAGVTQTLVDAIHEKWKADEVVKLKFEGPPVLNMKRTHDILESRTGGLVIWRSGSSIVLYRGLAYKLPCVQTFNKENEDQINVGLKDVGGDIGGINQLKDSLRTRESFNRNSAEHTKELSEEELLELSELNLLLDELGPRYEDWSGREPLPVNADLLPSVVPGFKTPYRLLPYGTRQSLTNKEMTSLRRLARRMPPHFALGRSRALQGLATAMAKLWEKSAIAKIAIKRGVQNTLNDRMSEELRTLTGGTLLSRNKDYIVFYRGNDFLPHIVTRTLKEREKLTELRQDKEEQARQVTRALIGPNVKATKGPLVAGTLAETVAAISRWGSQQSSEDIEKMRRDSAVAKHASLVRYLEKKLVLAKSKIKRAERALSKVQEDLEPADLPCDLETLSDEERFLFRKIGLSMKPFLLLGRRGIFDGTVENMHLHWKFRELVKIIVRGKSFAQVKHTAISLEAESGGVLVSLDKTTKGYAVIVYRGKNYQRPYSIRPRNLLTRRQALARSIELQRREALKHHISDLEEQMELLKSGLEEMSSAIEIDEEKYSRLGNVHCLEDNEEQDEGEEAYLEIYSSEDEDSDAENKSSCLEDEQLN